MAWYILIGFTVGLLFYHYLLDREEVKNVFNARVKQKGRGNIMNIRKGETESIISGDMKRNEVISIWKGLKKNVTLDKNN